MWDNYKLNGRVINNFSKARLKLLSPAILLLLVIIFILLKKSSFNADGYVEIQKNLFFYLNSLLSKLPTLQLNLTQLGDALILFPLLTVFIVYAPKLWGAILASSIISLVLSVSLKNLFSIPRPAVALDHESFVIIGEAMISTYTSLPSGHSITIFTIITILLFAFMPKKPMPKILWSSFILILGLIIAFSRVAVGAHYPLDVVVGSAIGYISALIGIIINNNIGSSWVKNKKYYPILLLLLIAWILLIFNKIAANNLLIFYFSLIGLISTSYLITKAYAKK